MSRRIPDGAYCLFRAPVEGTRQGKVVLVQHRAIADPDHGGSYTVKVYERSRSDALIVLRPDSLDVRYRPIEVRPGDDEELRVVAELVEVLPGRPQCSAVS